MSPAALALLAELAARVIDTSIRRAEAAEAAALAAHADRLAAAHARISAVRFGAADAPRPKGDTP